MFESRSKNLAGGYTLLYAWFPSMHSRVDIALISAQPEEQCKVVVGQVQQLLSKLEKIGNKFDTVSELSMVNRLASAEAVQVSRILLDILSLCTTYNSYTEGYFDICASLSRQSVPTSDLIVLSKEEQTVRFTRPDVELDLSGFLKGYALDLAKLYLEQEGYSNVFMNFGTSSILAMGDGADGSGWPVQTARDDEWVWLKDSFFSTSGNESEERAHILNPHTGQYVRGKGVVCLETTAGYVGEVLSTALFSAGSVGQQEDLFTRLKVHPEVSKLLKSAYLLKKEG